MGLLENLHKERQIRLERIRKAAQALENTKPEPEPEFELEDGPWNKFDLILDEVCAYYKVRKMDILSHRRFNSISEKRHVLAFILQSLTRMTLSQMGAKMNRDETSVGYGIKKIQSKYDNYREDIETIKQRIKKSISSKRDKTWK